MSSIDDHFDPIDFLNRLACRTKSTGRYQSDIYTGLISSNRTSANGQIMTRLEQLITTHHDDQIRSLLLILRHYSMKHQWNSILFHLKSLLQSSFCRAYLRLYWQLIFRYLIEHFSQTHQIDLIFLSQIFESLFHSPTINRTQTFYSYLCIYLLNPQTISMYTDIETRFKNLPAPFSSGRYKHVPTNEEFNPKFEQLLIINLHFLYDYCQWLNDYSLVQFNLNPFQQTIKISIDNEKNLELWTFKLTTNFHEIQYLSNEFFDHYDIYLLKYLHFLYLTKDNHDEIRSILESYCEQYRNYLNAYKYAYWFDRNERYLKKLIELDPSCSPYVLIYCQQITNQIERFDRLFDYFDYEKNRNDNQTWTFFCKNFFQITTNDQSLVECIRQNWNIRKMIWKKFHFLSFNNNQINKAWIAYVLHDNQKYRNYIRDKWLNNNEQIKQADLLHQYLTTSN